MLKNRTSTHAVGVLVALLTLSACVSAPPDPGAAPTEATGQAVEFNSQDVRFTRSMIEHHAQAVEMVDTLGEKEGVEPDLLELAEGMRMTQESEIEAMDGWLDLWATNRDISGMGRGMMSDGMMSDTDMHDLSESHGGMASQLFREQMIDHHRGAISMAEAEVEMGRHAGAIELARGVLTSQQAEIDQMRSMH